jgi:hypothetical protein
MIESGISCLAGDTFDKIVRYLVNTGALGDKIGALKSEVFIGKDERWNLENQK